MLITIEDLNGVTHALNVTHITAVSPTEDDEGEIVGSRVELVTGANVRTAASVEDIAAAAQHATAPTVNFHEAPEPTQKPKPARKR